MFAQGGERKSKKQTVPLLIVLSCDDIPAQTGTQKCGKQTKWDAAKN